MQYPVCVRDAIANDVHVVYSVTPAIIIILLLLLLNKPSQLHK